MFFSDAFERVGRLSDRSSSLPIVPRPCLMPAVEIVGGGDELLQFRIEAFVGHQLADRAAAAADVVNERR